MNCNNNAHFQIIKIGIICMAILFGLMIVVKAGNIKVNNVTVKLLNGSELNIVTSKTNVADILEENHILILEDQKVIPELWQEIDESKTIRIVKQSDETYDYVEASNENNEET